MTSRTIVGWSRTPSGDYCHPVHTDLIICRLRTRYPSNFDGWALRQSDGSWFNLVSTFPTLRKAIDYVNVERGNS